MTSARRIEPPSPAGEAGGAIGPPREKRCPARVTPRRRAGLPRRARFVAASRSRPMGVDRRAGARPHPRHRRRERGNRPRASRAAGSTRAGAGVAAAGSGVREPQPVGVSEPELRHLALRAARGLARDRSDRFRRLLRPVRPDEPDPRPVPRRGVAELHLRSARAAAHGPRPASAGAPFDLLRADAAAGRGDLPGRTDRGGHGAAGGDLRRLRDAEQHAAEPHDRSATGRRPVRLHDRGPDLELTTESSRSTSPTSRSLRDRTRTRTGSLPSGRRGRPTDRR
jgi:hypothetical protein